jgi:serine/threonine protein kinase
MSIINLNKCYQSLELNQVKDISEKENEQLKRVVNFLRENSPETVSTTSTSRDTCRKIKAKTNNIPYNVDFDSVTGDFVVCLGELAKGKYKVVKKYISLSTLQVVAIGKQMITSDLDRRFAYKEIEMLLKCKGQKNILQIISHEKYISKKKNDTEIVKIVSRYYNKGDLSRSTLTPLEKLQTAVQIISGAMALHRLGIIHRDLKLANILCEKVTDSDEKEALHSVVADLGLACWENDDPDSSSTQCGSRIYMSPQCLRKAEATIFDDSWSVGVVLSELFFGTSPLHNAADEKELLEIMDRMNDEKHNPCPKDDESIEYVIWKLMRPEIYDRMTLPKALNLINALIRNKK